MDTTTKTMALSLASGIIKKGLITLGASAATHGIISGSQTETFVSVGMFLVGVGWSFWNDYGRAIVLSQLEVLKARSLAAAAKIHDAGLPAVTVNEIAAQSPTMTPADVTKVAAGLPAEVKASVLPKVVLVLFALLVLWPDALSAQQPRRTGNIVQDIKTAVTEQTTKPATGDTGLNLLKALDTKLLPDLQYALLLAKASNSAITSNCWQAWVDVIQVRQTAVKDAQGNEVPLPEPHLVTTFEQLVELRNMLQPDSKFMTACSPVANMVKMDVAKFMGIVITGGAGLASLGFGL